jgi:uncharacterized protein
MRSYPISQLVSAFVVAAMTATTLAAQRPQVAVSKPSPLIQAVQDGRADVVKSLLEKAVDVNASAADGTTALHWAAQVGNDAIAKLLLDARATVDQPNRYGVRPLLLASESGSFAVIKLLLDRNADPNGANPASETPLMLASRSGSVESVRLLLARGADVNARETLRGQTALMWAAAEGHEEVIEALIAGGADVSAAARGPQAKVQSRDVYFKPTRSNRLDAFTPLLFAVQQGRIAAARTLLRHGAWVNESAPDGTSALVLAIANGHYELASILLDEGADPNLAGQGWNALVQVVRTKNPSIGQAPRVVPTGSVSPMELAKKLIAWGVDIDAPITQQIRDRYRTHMDMVGATAYLMAAKAADAEMMKLLLTAGANPQVTTKAGRTALMVAAGIDMWYVNEDSGTNEDALEALKVALAAGADVNAVNNDGETALHGAAFRGSNEMVQLLVDAGAKLDVVSKLGFTPLMVANGDQRISCNLQRRPWTVELLTKIMTDRGIPIKVRTDEEKFRDGVSRGYANSRPQC